MWLSVINSSVFFIALRCFLFINSILCLNFSFQIPECLLFSVRQLFFYFSLLLFFCHFRLTSCKFSYLSHFRCVSRNSRTYLTHENSWSFRVSMGFVGDKAVLWQFARNCSPCLYHHSVPCNVKSVNDFVILWIHTHMWNCRWRVLGNFGNKLGTV